MSFKIWLLISASVLLVQDVSPARILCVVPTPSYSHQMFFQQFWRELAIRGHDVVVITTDPTGEKLTNFKEISIREVYQSISGFVEALMHDNIYKLIGSGKWNDLFLQTMDSQMALPQMQELLSNKSEHFDLVFVEHLFNINYALKHRFNCPFIGVFSMDGMTVSHEAMGNAVHSILYPWNVIGSSASKSSFVQRLHSVLLGNLYNLRLQWDTEKYSKLMRKYFGEGVPNMFELQDSTDMLFVNSNPLFNAIRPFTPSTISVAGGIHMKPVQPLPQDIQEFLDNANEGAIYFSLGSSVQTNMLPLQFRQLCIETLRQLPYKILWKFEDDSIEGKPDNVKLIKWAPQQDILRHKNVKLFITQGGLQSLEETLYSYVPVVMIPFIADQRANAEKVADNGMGIQLDWTTISVEKFKSAIIQIMTNQTYQDNVNKLGTRIQDEPMSPMEKAVWWTEYVLRHGGAQHLKGPRIPAYQYYYLDVMALIATILTVFGIVTVMIIKILIRQLLSKLYKQKLKKQ